MWDLRLVVVAAAVVDVDSAMSPRCCSRDRSGCDRGQRVRWGPQW